MAAACQPLVGLDPVPPRAAALLLAIWSRARIGARAVLPVALALGWIWLNPRLFPEPRRHDAWMSRAVLGERVWIEHRAAVAPHHRRAARLLAWASLPGLAATAAGLAWFWWEGVVFGAVLAVLPKAWFCDRMVWILADWERGGRAAPGMEGLA